MASEVLSQWIVRSAERGAVRWDLRQRGAANPLDTWAAERMTVDLASRLGAELEAVRREDYADQGYTAEVAYVATAYGPEGAIVGERSRVMRPAAPLAAPQGGYEAAPLLQELANHARAVTGMLLEQSRDTANHHRRVIDDQAATIAQLLAERKNYEGVAIERLRIETDATVRTERERLRVERARASGGAWRDAAREVTAMARPALAAYLGGAGRPAEGLAALLSGLSDEQAERLRAVLPGSVLGPLLRGDLAAVAEAIRGNPKLAEDVAPILNDAQLAGFLAWLEGQAERGAEPPGTTV